MFVVAGITGHTGSAAADALLHAGHQVRGITRDAARAEPWRGRGVEMVTSTLTDAKALTHIFDGADGAYVLAPPDLQHPDPVGLYTAVAHAFREAARATHLRRIVFLSSYGAQLPTGTGPIRGLHEAEAVLRDAAPEVICLRPASFMENWHGVLGPARDAGILPTFLADLDRRSPTVATHDIGVVAAALLTEAAPPSVVELRGPADYSVREVADVMAAVLGRAVAPVQPPREAWEGVLQQTGVGAAYAALIAEMYDGANAGILQPEGVADQRRGTRTLQETVQGWLSA